MRLSSFIPFSRFWVLLKRLYGETNFRLSSLSELSSAGRSRTRFEFWNASELV